MWIFIKFLFIVISLFTDFYFFLRHHVITAILYNIIMYRLKLLLFVHTLFNYIFYYWICLFIKTLYLFDWVRIVHGPYDYIIAVTVFNIICIAPVIVICIITFSYKFACLDISYPLSSKMIRLIIYNKIVFIHCKSLI